MRSLLRLLMDMAFRRPAPTDEARSRAIHADADRTAIAERARLARLRPIIDRLPTRADWQRMYEDRLGR